MPAARELLLDAAFVALAARPWSGVRMVDVAAAAGVSRQTLYNEFGGKDGLGRALVRREADAFLAGVERTLADAAARGIGDPGDHCAAVALWTLRTARTNPLVRAVLTGCRSERLPATAPAAVPAQRARPETPVLRGAPTPTAMADRITDRVAGAITTPAAPEEARRACAAAVRLTLSYVLAPGDSDEVVAVDVARLARALLADA
ncbi:Bacterial regulatory proteins, tetR family [Streptomyces netropsis]|uniref:AcrR family transcriptional regulator n=1 Tax=Streptomyces syringium TaxID=76729 RepID=A0ABS4Y8K5_9ACTN|nr:helix-turn-helix domain-containing protein [Streptomyces syringium]MBP2405036.1 AcrR family transcriptional regulator [Streptomyces syringium]SPE58021.1 Bacterial regulatory proteins, tetR family [Streptomyces netropsis]